MEAFVAMEHKPQYELMERKRQATTTSQNENNESNDDLPSKPVNIKRARLHPLNVSSGLINDTA